MESHNKVNNMSYIVSEEKTNIFKDMSSKDHVKKFPQMYFTSGRKEYGLNYLNKLVTYEQGEISSAVVDCIYEILDFGMYMISKDEKTFRLNTDICVTHSANQYKIKFTFSNVSKSGLELIKNTDLYSNVVKVSDEKIIQISNVVAISELFESSINTNQIPFIESSFVKGVLVKSTPQPINEAIALNIKFTPDISLNIMKSNPTDMITDLNNIIRFQLLIFKSMYEHKAEKMYFGLGLNEVLKNSKLSKMIQDELTEQDYCLTQNVYRTIIIDRFFETSDEKTEK
jgi:hypothetical protein